MGITERLLGTLRQTLPGEEDGHNPVVLHFVQHLYITDKIPANSQVCFFEKKIYHTQ